MTLCFFEPMYFLRFGLLISILRPFLHHGWRLHRSGVHATHLPLPIRLRSISNVATTESCLESVHLKLKDQNICSCGDFTDHEAVKEYVELLTNNTILACMGTVTSLQHLSIHVYGFNYSMNDSVYFREV